jgi:hypothetical protein
VSFRPTAERHRRFGRRAWCRVEHRPFGAPLVWLAPARPRVVIRPHVVTQAHTDVRVHLAYAASFLTRSDRISTAPASTWLRSSPAAQRVVVNEPAARLMLAPLTARLRRVDVVPARPPADVAARSGATGMGPVAPGPAPMAGGLSRPLPQLVHRRAPETDPAAVASGGQQQLLEAGAASPLEARPDGVVATAPDLARLVDDVVVALDYRLLAARERRGTV